jgi:DNA-binding NarL/FixJ family response regulator
MSATKYKLAIVDDHQIVIDGLRSLLKGYDQYDIVIESNHPETIPSLLQKQEIDLMLTDVMMPVMTGVELARTVKKDFPSIKIIALSMNGEGSLVNQMIEESDISG